MDTVGAEQEVGDDDKGKQGRQNDLKPEKEPLTGSVKYRLGRDEHESKKDHNPDSGQVMFHKSYSLQISQINVIKDI